MSLLQTLIAFVVALGILVTFHEFGHYWVARRCGVKILRFSIGFGRPLRTWLVGPDRTELSIASVPLGGYVKLLDEREGEVAPAELPRAFNRQPLRSRTAIVLAGPLANFLLAVVVYWAMYVVGVSGPRPIVGAVAPEGIAATAGMRAGDEILTVDGAPTVLWDDILSVAIAAVLDHQSVALRVRGVDAQEREITLDVSRISIDELSGGEFFAKVGFDPQRPRLPPRIGQVIEGEPAARAGLRAGDLILAVGTEPVVDWVDWVERVRASAGQPLAVEVERGGERLKFEVVPRATSEDGRLIGRIGAEVAPPDEADSLPVVTERYGPIDAGRRALDRTAEVTITTLKFLRKMLLGEASVQNLSGPLSIAQYAGESAKLGVSRFLEFLGLVSVSLAVLNLLPIPLLDGGHLMFYLIEFAARRPVPETVQIYGQQVGLVLLLGLMGLAVYNDIMRIF